MAKVSASILGADSLNLEKDIEKVRDADFLHFDVMDGHSVPNLSFGTKVYKKIQETFPKVRVEVHLMVENSEKFVEMFPKAYVVIFHPVTTKKAGKLVRDIHSSGSNVGLALNPDEEIDNIMPFLKEIDLVLVMGVYAGFGGQKFIVGTLEKIKSLREVYKGVIEVDGGANDNSARAIVEAGADVLVSGSFLFAKDTKKRLLKLQHL